jgi:hypothetical protein
MSGSTGLCRTHPDVLGATPAGYRSSPSLFGAFLGDGVKADDDCVEAS